MLLCVDCWQCQLGTMVDAMKTTKKFDKNFSFDQIAP